MAGDDIRFVCQYRSVQQLIDLRFAKNTGTSPNRVADVQAGVLSTALTDAVPQMTAGAAWHFSFDSSS